MGLSNYNFLEEKYSSLGLSNNRLNNLYDLFRLYKINVMLIPGFIDLNTSDREVFSEFIINFYNMHGLEARENIIPTGMHYVEDRTYFCINPEDHAKTQWGRDLFDIKVKETGQEMLGELLYSSREPRYADLPVVYTDIKSYYRFDFIENGCNKWVHVLNESMWY